MKYAKELYDLALFGSGVVAIALNSWVAATVMSALIARELYKDWLASKVVPVSDTDKLMDVIKTLQTDVSNLQMAAGMRKIK